MLGTAQKLHTFTHIWGGITSIVYGMCMRPLNMPIIWPHTVNSQVDTLPSLHMCNTILHRNMPGKKWGGGGNLNENFVFCVSVCVRPHRHNLCVNFWPYLAHARWHDACINKHTHTPETNACVQSGLLHGCIICFYACSRWR